MINIDELIKVNMKSRNQIELRAYKNLKAEIQAFKTAKNAKPYDEAAEIQLISKMCKKLEDSILSFSEAHRDDLVSEYRDELEILKKLLPEPIGEQEICFFIGNDKEYFSQFVDEYLCESGKIVRGIQIPKKEMGNAIKYLKSKFPQADGKLISKIVKESIV
ncbi:GatB/YqeY domain-containing protein [Intestinibacter sp.]|uniref:GatB/YqeY domain-containing protein n=1 Tax=Intestinibacter sp. TaxID=1965304 RepID=UPI003F18F233